MALQAEAIDWTVRRRTARRWRKQQAAKWRRRYWQRNPDAPPVRAFKAGWAG